MPLDSNSLIELLTKPYKLQIVQSVMEKGECTAKELLALHPSIPQATLYRQLTSLVDENYLIIKKVQMVRALSQKIYAVNPELIPDANSIILENNGLGYYNLFSNFMLSLLKEFQDYANQPSIQIMEDGSGFHAIPIYGSASDLQELGAKLNTVIREYRDNNPAPTEEKKYHLLATIITPPKDMNEE